MLMTVGSVPEQVPPIILASTPSVWEKVAAAATASNAVVVVVSAVVAWCAWQSEIKRSSKRNVAEFITSVTMGPTAEARDHLGTLARSHKGGGGDARTRHLIFEILWALDRASALVSDVKHVDDVYREALKHHVTQMTDSLGNLPKTVVFADVGWFGKPDYSESVAVTTEGLKALADKIGEPECGKTWGKGLSNLKSKEKDSQSAEAVTTDESQ